MSNKPIGHRRPLRRLLDDFKTGLQTGLIHDWWLFLSQFSSNLAA